MRKIFALIVLLTLSCTVRGQKIIDWYYWFDDDTIVKYVNLSSGQMDIDISTLTPGMHYIHIQTKDDTGLISNMETRPFLRMSMPSNQKLYYWFEGDTIPTCVTNLQDSIAIDVSNLQEGSNMLYLQMVDNEPMEIMSFEFIKTPQPQAYLVVNDGNDVEMKCGEEQTIVATLQPANTTCTDVTWSSSDETIATVSSEGLVSALSIGTATITATTNDGKNLSASCKVTVAEGVILATSIKLSKSALSLKVGKTSTITPTVSPNYATDKSVTWSSSNESVATVSSEGVVTAIAAGTATITATTNDGSNLSASCEVTVTEEEGGGGCAEPSTDLSEYDYALYFNDTEARSGTNATLQLNMKNKAEDVTAFECKVVLPEGVTWATTTDKRGNVILVQPTFNTTTERTDVSYHTISNVKQVSDGSYYIIVYSDQKEYIADLDGAVLDIPVVLSEDIEAGDYNIILKSIVITKTNTTDVKIDRIVSRLTVPSYVLGDANGDTFINVSDIVTIISYMMEENPDPFIFAAADVNADTYVNVTDVVGVIDIMMDNANAAKPRAAAKKTSKASATSGSDYLLKVAPLTVAKDATSLGATLDLINAQEDITAFECKVYLPAGIEWTSTTDKRGNVNLTQPTFNATTERTDASYHTISAVKQMADGGYYVIVYSDKKEYILDNDGAVLDLPLKLAEDVADGVYDIKVDGMVITHTNGTDVKPAAYTTSIIVGNPTEIALKGDLDASTLSVYEPAWKNNSKVTSLDVSAASGIAEETSFSMANPNALLFVSEGTSVSNTDNVVKGSTCAQLTLIDDYNFKSPKAFTATKATYSRDLTGYGTICLPYTPSTDGFKYYELAEDDGTALKFTKVETPQANTPYIYTKTGSDTAITGSGVEISADGAGEVDMEGDNWKMVGTYETVTLTYPTDDIYALSGGVLYHNTGNLTMTPFRAYFKKDNGPTVKSVNIIVEDETTGIVDVDVDADVDSVMFNLAGQKVAEGYKGIVIKNGKKVLVK